MPCASKRKALERAVDVVEYHAQQAGAKSELSQRSGSSNFLLNDSG